MSKELLEASRDYYLARIELEQPEPDERLFTALGQVAYELLQLTREDEV